MALSTSRPQSGIRIIPTPSCLRDDPGDHLHPNDAGYKVMGDAIDLKLFTLKPKQP